MQLGSNMNPLLAREYGYEINGMEVSARVLKVEQAASGAIEVIVQASCPHPDGQVHHQTNTLTLTDPSGGQQLDDFMRECARWLYKLLWEKPHIVIFVAELLKSDN